MKLPRFVVWDLWLKYRYAKNLLQHWMYCINGRYVRRLYHYWAKHPNCLDPSTAEILQADYFYVEWDGDAEVALSILSKEYV